MFFCIIHRNNHTYQRRVIIPVYNAEKHLKRCLDSVISQTYKNLEILIVDDGSVDGSSAICSEYAAVDERISVIRQENQGVSAARNRALEIFRGAYVVFADADDWIEADMVQAFVNSADAYGASLVVSAATDRNEDGTISDVQPELPEEVMEIDIASDFSFQEEYAHGVVWGNLFKRECIDNLRFAEDLYVGEDSLFFAQAVKNSKKLVFLPKQYYNYVLYEGSALHGEFNERKFTEVIAWKRVTEVFRENDEIYKSACVAYGLRCVNVLNKMHDLGTMEEPFYSELLKAVRSVRQYFGKSPVSGKMKLKVCLLSLAPKLYFAARKRNGE